MLSLDCDRNTTQDEMFGAFCREARLGGVEPRQETTVAVRSLFVRTAIDRDKYYNKEVALLLYDTRTCAVALAAFILLSCLSEARGVPEQSYVRYRRPIVVDSDNESF